MNPVGRTLPSHLDAPDYVSGADRWGTVRPGIMGSSHQSAHRDQERELADIRAQSEERAYEYIDPGSARMDRIMFDVGFGSTMFRSRSPPLVATMMSAAGGPTCRCSWTAMTCLE